ncbi:MAG: adenosylcobinamide-GDP ribazoletransferase [Acidimicrobiia bacterium]|nr:adenosylcobinamide-GDP ribazoletransferase [Acidimicrobiia bacterium]
MRSPAFSGFLGAVQFLTRVPVRLSQPPDPARSVPWFPVVGGLIGLVVGAVAAGSMELVPSPVAATLAIATGLALTGAFHEDGLADFADALGGWSREQRIQILQDSRHGSYGVAAMCTTILLRVACVMSLGPAAALGGLVAAHALGRGAAVGVLGWAPRAHEAPDSSSGLGAEYSVSKRRAAAGVGAAVAIAAAATGWWVGPLAAAAAIGAVVTAALAIRALGRIVGDVLGAIEQVGECLVLVVVSGLAARHTLWWA